jgi:nucleoside-diphosphate-sugar epimerase
MTRTTVITGAGGFVGSHMAAGFVAMGDAVIAIDSHFDAATHLRLAGAEIIEAPLSGDMLDPARRVDLVIHGAAITTPPADLGMTDEGHIQTNVDLVRQSLALATTHRASDFVFLSSSGVFAIEDGDGIHLESTNPTAAIPYSLAKRSGEEATQAAHSATLRAISARLGPIYGPAEAARTTRQTVSQVRRWLDRAQAGEAIIVQAPEERRDWTFAPDLPRALSQLLGLQPRFSGVVHLTSAEIVSNLDLAQRIAGLVDGAIVRVEPHGEGLRLPMRSDRIDMTQLYAWTPLNRGLALTYASGGAL